MIRSGSRPSITHARSPGRRPRMNSTHKGRSLALAAALLAASIPASAAVTADEALTRALGHVRANPSSLGVGAADVADLAVTSNYASGHNGVTHVNLNQRYQGLEVFGAH